MPSVCVRPYESTDAPVWDDTVRRSRNGNFIHLRGYMDYHSDRFEDCSLIVEYRGRPVAVLPANRDDTTAVSHSGLTYGGLIATESLRTEATLGAFDAIADHYRLRGFKRLVYKAIPHLFHRYPTEEDLYALFRVGARLVRRDVSTAIDLRAPLAWSAIRRRMVDKADKVDLTLERNGDLAEFHALLSDVLRRRFDTTPTHSLDELLLLKLRFPGEITLFTARRNDALHAAVLVYDFGAVVHTQYLAASEEGRAYGALDWLLARLIKDVYGERNGFSFGISTQDSGRMLNTGLAAYKEAFGARAVVHDFYEWVF